MQDSKWQLRFYPDMYILDDSLRLEPVVITGSAYRKAQLKGYEQYERFLSKIVSDTLRFVDINQLEIFLRRNIPQIYAFKTDSSEVSDEQFESIYGVTEREAVEHYTNKFARYRNNRRKAFEPLPKDAYVVRILSAKTAETKSGFNQLALKSLGSLSSKELIPVLR